MGNGCIIRKAEYEDIPAIMAFIDQYWKKDHILAKSRRFFEYQHYYNKEVSFIIAEVPETKEMEGILGYILYSEGEERDLFGAIWKVRTNNYPMLGMKMQLYAVRNLNARTFSAVALNPTTLDMHRKWGAVLGKLKQYYILAGKDEYNIAKIESRQKIIDYNKETEQFELGVLLKVEDVEAVCVWESENGKVPLKSYDFIKHRYFNHPAYHYLKYAIYNKGKIAGIFIAREIECNNSKILRIVDFLGDVNAIAHTGKALRGLLEKGGYEYIDFYLFGINDKVLNDAGFTERKENDENVIPNYFEPFIQENIDIDFYTSSKEEIVLFKGDGDQDRPNTIKE